MKQRPCRTPRRPGTHRPALHPIGLAAMLALAGPAFALPQGATVVNGQVTIATPAPSLQVVTQGTSKAIIDWKSFSIGAGERVRFDQPSSSAVLLNRVTGYDPSEILGQMQSNGRIFLLNPYGVVFGSAARIDVGGLVASSLSLANADFLAGRYALNATDPAAPAQRGPVRNDGTISAPGGVVVLAGPNVVNTGSIDAAAGRVGLAAAQEVLVDVEGDGLILFQAKAGEVGNRLAQLGRIQADGGSVELRAAARGAFADTVLNMTGTVQARSLGLRQGKVVIDGGEAGVTRVAGLVDSSSPDAPAGGGRVEVTGQKVLLDDGARLDASGQGGGGTVLVGGDWQGQGPLRNTEQTHVAAGAQVDVSAIGSGSAGTAVVWSDDTTRFFGHIAARGGAAGGDGGRIEVSGKRHLDFAGTVDANAPAGRGGSLLLDPSNIEITTSNEAISTTAPFVGSATDSKLDVTRLVNAVNGTDVTVDATGDPASPPVGSATTPTITVSTAIAWNSTHTLTLKADGTISVAGGAPISNGGTGGLNLFTDGAVNVGSTITLNGGAFKVAGTAGGATPAASYSGGTIVTTGGALSAGGAVTIATTGSLTTGDITTRGGTGGGATAGGLGGTVTLSAVDGALSTGAIDTRGGNAGNTSTGVFAGGAAGAVQLSIGTPTAARTLSTGTITATGGTGSNRTSGNVAGGIGGAGGTVQIANADGGVSVAGVDSSGGSGGDAANNGNPGGTGGAAHAVTVSSATGTVAVGAVTAIGGAEGSGDDSGAAGARASITLSAGTSLNVTGALDAGTGTGASTIELKFGQAGNGGTLDLNSIPSIAASTLKATGGASTTADRLVASSNAATITLTDTSLVLTPSTSYTLAAVDAAELSGGAGSNTINAPGGVGGWSGALTVNRSGGAADVVHGNGANTTLVDSTNTASTYNITGANTGSVGNTSFDGVAKIVAGSLNDNFVVAAGGSLASITGGTGTNTLDLSGKTAAVTIDLQNRSATDVTSFSGITDVVGRDGTTGTDTTLIGTNANQTIDITGPNIGVAAGVNFFGVGNLTGGSGTNTFAFRSNLVQSGSLAGNLVGSGNDVLDLSGRTGAVEFRLATAAATPIGGSFSGITSLVGNDLGGTTTTTLIGANGTQTIDITAANSGLAGGIGFFGVGNVTAGSGTNTFAFGASGSVSGNLVGNGTDTLDLSARSGPIEFRLAAVLSEATPIGGKFSGMTTLVGNDLANSTNTTLIGSSGGQTFTLTAANTGTAGAIGFSRVGNLTGGGGSDTFTGSGGSLSGSLADGGGATTLNGTITTGAGQTYDGAITLGSATVLASSSGGNIRFGSTLDGTQTLAVNTGGTTTFAGAVGAGAGTALASLSTDAGGTTVIQGGSVRTGGTQTYGDAVSAGTLTLTSLNAGGHLQASNAGNDFGTLSLATTGATDVTIRDTNALALGSVTLGSGTNSFTAGTQLSRGALPTAGSALTLSVGAGGLVDPSVNTFFTSGAASSVLVAAGSGVTHNVTAGGVGALPGLVVSGNLTLNAGAAITQAAALTVDGSTTVNAGANPITLTAPANDLKGAITLNNSGANDIVLVNAASATQIGGIGAGSGALTITSAGPIGQSGAITQTGPGAVVIGAGANVITLTDANNDFAGTVTPTGTAIQLADRNALTLGTLAVGSLNVTSQGALNLGSGSVGGDLVAASNGGAVTQTGALSVTGNTSVAAGNAGIDLSNAANSWGGSVALSNSGAGSVALSDSGALLLAGVSVGSGPLNLTAGGPITQSAAITQTGAGAVAINAGASDITLVNAGNNFAGAVGLTGATVQIVDQNALALGAGSIAGDLGVTSNGGAITQSGALAVGGNSSFAAGTGSIALTHAANSFGGSVGLSTSGAGSVALTSGGALSLGAVNLGTGALTLNAAGPVTQTTALTQGPGAASVTIGAAGAVALDQAGNDFTGPVSVTVAGANSISLRDANALPLGTLTMGGGTLGLVAAGDITQTGPISAAGTTTISAGTGNVTLANAANNFLGTVTVSGAAIDVRDANDLSVAATPALNRSLSLIAGGTLTLLGGGSIDTGSADLTLASGTGLGTGGTLAGTNLSLAGGSGGIALNNDVLARGTLTLQSSNAPILQFGGNLTVAGSSSVAAGAAPVSLASAGNDFTGPVSVTVSGANSVSLRDANALPLGTLTMGSGALGLTAAGDITQTGTITVGGTTSLSAGGGSIVLTQAGNDFSTVAATGGNVALTDANALVLGPVQAARLDVVTGNAALGQSGAAVVSGATRIDAGSAAVDLTQAGNRFGSIGINGGAVALVNAGPLVLDGVTATSLSVNTAAANGAIGQSAPLAVGGATGIDAGSGDVTLNDPANTFATLALRGGALNVVDANDLAISSLSAAPNRAVSLVAGGTLTLPPGGIDTGSADLLLASNAGTLTTRGALAGRAVGLAGSTGIVLGGNVTSSTDQTYANAVTLAADTTLNAGAGRITLQGPVDGGAHDLGLASGNAATDAIRSAGPIVNTNRLTVAGNSTLGGNVTTTGTQSYGGRLTLGGTIELNAGNGGIVLQGAVDGGGHDLRLTSGGAAADTIRADGPITGVGAFTAAGNTTLAGGGVTGSGEQTYAGRLTLGATTTLNAGAGRILLQGAVDGGGHDLLLASGSAADDAIRTSAAVNNVARFDAGGNTTLGSNVTSSGDQRYAAALTLADDATLAAGAGRIALLGTIDGGGHRLGLASSAAQADAIRTGAAITNTTQLDVAGRLALGGSVTTSGAQSYLDALRLDAPATLTGSRVAFAATVDGAQALTLRSPDIVFGAAVGTGTALASLDVGSAGRTHVGGNITTSGTQTFGNAVELDGPSVMSGSTLRFDGPVDGAQALTLLGGAATAVLNGTVGAGTPLASLSIVGPTTLGGGTVATTGAQSYGGPVTLTADALLSGSTLAMNGGVAGAHALDLQFSGPSSLGGAIGAGTPLASLNSSGPLTLLADSISTSGAQTFGSTLQLSGNTRLSGGSLDFAGAVGGAGDLLLQTDTLHAAAAIAGTGTLAISPLDTGRTIGVAGGAGALQVTQAVLDNAAGFARHVVGRADGSGTIDVGAMQLRSNTALQTGSGDIRLNGSVDGAFDLALNSAGTTRIAGPVGAGTALRSLSTDHQGGSAEGTQFDSGDGSAVRVFTSGAQTYADAVDARGPLQLRGTTITADQAGNRFAGTVVVLADRLQLRSGAGLSLGDVTLADGGRVEADGVLRLVGALRLDGGTLSLVSNALPTGVTFTDDELLSGETLALGFTPLQEASATIVQETGATVASGAGSLLVLRSPGGGSILLDRLVDGQTVNTLLGDVSAVSGALGDNTRFATPGQNPNEVTIGFIRLASSEIHVAGAPPAPGAADPLRAGLEADALKLTADTLTTGPTGLLRARLPFLNTQGSDSSLPGLTLVMSPQALTVANAFGLPNPDGFIQVRIGSALGGYLTVRPKEAGGENAVVLLAGPEPRPFYDGAGKLTEVRVFYNGDTPRTPQESGALTAVTAIVEDARHARFEEAVRTENVSSRLRSGVIAEVGSGRPATVGRESIKLPQNCGVKPGSLQCE